MRLFKELRMFAVLLKWLGNHPIPAFFVLTFSIAWAIWLPLGLFAPEQPLASLPGAWAPTISTFILTGLVEGWAGLKSLLKKLLHWRVGLGWYLVVLFGIAAIAYLAIGIGRLFGVPVPEITLPGGLPREVLIGFLPIFLLINIFVGGPLAEDVGWRGYTLPKMRERMSALSASLLIGVIWAVWHLPFFIFPWRDLVGNIPFFWFVLLTTGWPVLFAWVYVNTESILVPVLFHAAINTTLGTVGVLGHGGEDLGPLILNTALTWAAVGLVVSIYGSDLRRDGIRKKSFKMRRSRLL
jgi:membrane protease YdiL (CAAX protease family)